MHKRAAVLVRGSIAHVLDGEQFVRHRSATFREDRQHNALCQIGLAVAALPLKLNLRSANDSRLWSTDACPELDRMHGDWRLVCVVDGTPRIAQGSVRRLSDIETVRTWAVHLGTAAAVHNTIAGEGRLREG
ncbi:hypothetical protein HBI80_095380 [Parastagonospora nodorum]|nr:hypothetical protein HBI80_095380 [Parastagonospora nodorum]KAH5473077.1 hypothetical protein HBI28_127050 [Parastagonospora nodorum]KAH5641212.1 hypothetical protein HBI22_058650 [Parastagonospora nodorum]KAH5688843.1 hypothetical protein HBI23_028200 [Parastagonospora nodorum]KAH6036168.1 hypothetical protein HBI82_028610 [Parastagonospora nodorum]